MKTLKKAVHYVFSLLKSTPDYKKVPPILTVVPKMN